jgi:diaminohydroxyphosphoribosylaminopyrimidine deaminase/5-amino-6-(5-phosphoribosylamino)uracil reductase
MYMRGSERDDPTMLASDEQFLRRAIRLAMNGRGSVEPNPMVGCVIVKNGRIIGEGFHARFGGPHAEPTALAACNEDPQGATAHVTLEPCCHLNKQTPPCVPRLIDARIGRVVVGCLDPNPEVNGRGITMLQDAGIVVDGPLLEAECKQLLAPFIARTILHRPYVTLKWAQTSDGKIAGPGGRRMQISNARSTEAVHRLRARCDAILVGINTVISDDPQLTARGVANPRPLLRCILDRRLRTPLQCNLVRSARDVPVLIGCDEEALHGAAAVPLRAAGVELLAVSKIQELLAHLHERKMSHLLVEPGPTLAEAFFEDGLVDRLWVFECSRSANDESAPGAATIAPDFQECGSIDLNGDHLREYLNTKSNLFFAPDVSADFEIEHRRATIINGKLVE